MASSSFEMQYDYRAGMPKACSDALRHLRRLGFAVVVLKPEQVGHPMHRGSIETAMLLRGTQRADELSHRNLAIKGVSR